jgi:hypothetical protein
MPARFLSDIFPLYIIAVWCFLSSVPASGQFELRSATIITQSDTLLGQVKYYDWDISPSVIDLVTENGPQRSIPAKEIRRMIIAPDHIYDGRQVSFSIYTKEVSSISAALVGQPTSAYLLLELLLESDAVKFYRLFDNQKQKRYFLEKEGVTHPLDYIQTPVVTDTRRSIYENPLFRSTLKQLLVECPTLRTDELPYTEAAIMALLREYHSYCRIDSRVYQEQKNIGKIKLSLGLLVSALPSGSNNGDNFRYGEAFQAGLSLRLILPKRFDNFFLIADIARSSIADAGFEYPAVNLAIYGGQYFGKKIVQGHWFTGISIGLGPLETGVGLSYKKMVSVSASFPIVYQLISDVKQLVPPALSFRCFIPLTK